ncbi:E3 ubiquitin-protein ligase APD2-like isoform X1 [Carya illinoinensis]|uniref:RING-type domain-containing protein n=2 Tax=Carya illinoinensis TaxID=32201 RepID=A0A8T1N6A1_CARIL|nr:E3 ubiquitin-protein ligase APD2-like isoform X1 [Carya illinoinensis]KAG6624547.1 hypothetical protein CIPAW_16G034800 [Carya illinoinensis]
MYRQLLTTMPSTSHYRRWPWWRETWAHLLAPLTIWLCVSVSIRYGFYGDSRMVLGPSSSRLMQASSVFVEQVEVRDDAKKGVLLYSFSEKPNLSSQANWSVSNYMTLTSHSRKGFFLWLNKGSTIRITCEAPTRALNRLQVVLKGERTVNTLLPKATSSPDALAPHEAIEGEEAEYSIEEDDKYYLGIINTNPRSIIINMRVNVSAKIYDTSKAKSMCSTLTGSCRINLLFPDTQYVVLATPDDGGGDDWYIDLSFVARLVTYIAILGFLVIVVYLILKYLGACDGESTTVDIAVPEEREVIETDHIMPVKPSRSTYGTGEEGEDSEADSSCSEELYDAKLCVICYDEQRNCFFVPCGHCATCYECASRIMDGESKVCPICRRLIHKLRRLFHS